MDFYVGMSLPVFDKEAAAKSCMGFSMMYGALAREAQRQGKMAWVEKPKLHLFQELGEYQSSELGNPSLFWSYKDEDYMNFVAKMAFRRGGAVSPTVTTLQVLERYCLWLANPLLEHID